LADQVGTLSQISDMTLPEQITAGGIQQVIQRRLHQLPEAVYPLLQRAAIAGHDLHLAVIERLAHGQDLAQWLMTCNQAAILEFEDSRWQFSHEKLRLGILADLSDAERIKLHRDVAVAIEEAYPHSDDQATALAYHWGAAGNVYKESVYAAIAGEQALQAGAYPEATVLLQKALDRFGERQNVSLMDRVSLESHLGQAYLGAGKLPEARAALQSALHLLGQPEPKSGFMLTISIFLQVVRQVFHRWMPSVFVGRTSGEASERLIKAARIYEQLSELYFYQSIRASLIHSVMRTLNLAERAQPSPQLVRAYGNAVALGGIMRQHGLAETYSRLSDETIQKVPHLPSELVALRSMGLYGVGMGQWENVRQWMEKAIAIGKQIGNLQVTGECIALLAWVYYHQGDFARSTRTYLDLEDLTRRSGSTLQLGWARRGQAQNHLRLYQDTLDEAAGMFQEALALFDRSTQSELRIDISAEGGLAMTRLRQGQVAEALKMSQAIVDILGSLPPTSFFLFEGVANFAEVILTIMETMPDDSQKLKRYAHVIVKTMNRFAGAFVICRPRATLWHGTFDWLDGKTTRAHKGWHKSLVAARQLGMPFEEGLAHFEIGRHLADTDPKRLVHLTAAVDIFRRLKTLYNFNRAQRLLNPAAAAVMEIESTDDIIYISKPTSIPNQITLEIDVSDL
jgi:tetratricopeptide (TPR) repeat protein